MRFEKVFAGREEQAADLISREGLTLSGDTYSFATDMARSYKAMALISVKMSLLMEKISSGKSEEEMKSLKDELNECNAKYFILKTYRNERINENKLKAV